MLGMLVLVAVIVFVVNLAARAINSPSRIGARGERAVAGRLRDGLPEEYRILNDTYLPLPDGTTTQIDHIVICQYGIFVVETKTYSGWIFGNENSAKWTQTIYHCKHSFQNPIRQNYRRICALSDNLKRRHSEVRTDSPAPKCPFCGGDMVMRHRRSDGAAFYGCRRYPSCKGIVNIAK